MSRQLVHIVGARPNFMKAAPVVAACRAAGQEPLLVHTGQHYDAAMSAVFFDELGMPQPDDNLGVGSGSHATQTAALLVAIEELLERTKPAGIVVYGDINSTAAASMVAAKMGVEIAHVEAGLRSFDRTMPEEINRIVTDALSSLHLVTSPEALGNLAFEGLPRESAHLVGNPMIDTLLGFRDVLDLEGARSRHGLPEEFGVVTVHRPANVDDPAVAAGIVEALAAVGKLLPLIVPLHPRGRAVLEAAGLMDTPGVHVVEPLGYLDFMALVAGARIVLTDSGGVQEETTILGVPCLTLRDNTERPITVSMGTNRLVGRDPAVIVPAAEDALASPALGQAPPLWDGSAGERIAAILAGWPA